MNRVILIGRLARDPEIRYTQSGKAFCRFTIAVDRRFSRAAQQEGQQTADFIPASMRRMSWQTMSSFLIPRMPGAPRGAMTHRWGAEPHPQRAVHRI